MADLVTVRDVELVTVGVNWPANIDVTVTFEHLNDMMVAANDDPHVTAPRVKLGHDKWQITRDGDTVDLGGHDPFWGGEPVFGSARNLRLVNDGAVLIGDLIDVPDWLAKWIPCSWPNRSCEWTWGGLDVRGVPSGVTTAGGKTYTAVLTAVALIGAYQPAVADLEDVMAILEHGPPDLPDLMTARVQPSARQHPTRRKHVRQHAAARQH